MASPSADHLKTVKEIKQSLNVKLGDTMIIDKVHWHMQTFENVPCRVIGIYHNSILLERTIVNWLGGINKYRFCISPVDIYLEPHRYKRKKKGVK